MNTKLISQSIDGNAEYLLVELSNSVCKVLLSCVYNPNKCCRVCDYFNVLSPLAVDYENIIVCGDFNVNLLSQDSYSSRLRDVVATVGLSFVNTSIPTRYGNNCCPSLLDYFIVSDPQSVLKFDQLSFISDHDLIFCSFDLNLNSDRTNLVNSHISFDYRFLNVDNLLNDLSHINWSMCWGLCTVNEKLAFLNDNVLSALRAHVPLRTFENRSSSCPWFNSAVQTMIRKRNKAYSRWKKNRSDANWSAFKAVRNEATSVIKREKRRFFGKSWIPHSPIMSCGET